MHNLPSIIETPPAEAEAIKVLQDMEASLTTAFAMYQNAVLAAFSKFWHGEVPPAELLALMGTHAGPWFNRHASAVTHFLSIGSDLAPEQYTPPVAYTTHEDGSITLD